MLFALLVRFAGSCQPAKGFGQRNAGVSFTLLN